MCPAAGSASADAVASATKATGKSSQADRAIIRTKQFAPGRIEARTHSAGLGPR
jgi:hypothetical protein